MNEHDPAAVDELYDEILERAQGVVDLDAAQLEAWTSGLFVALDDEAALLGFVAHAESQPSEAGAAVLAALAHLADGEVARVARRATDRMATLAPTSIEELGRARAAQAWRVQARFGTSLVIGFRQGPDTVDHAVLAEIEDGRLSDLQLAGPPSELLDPDVIGTDIEIADIEVLAALGELADAWDTAHAAGAPTTVGIATNQRLVRSRVRSELDRVLPLFADHTAEPDTSRGMSVEEIERADRAALGTLQSAVGNPASDAAGHAAWRDVVLGRVADLTPRELEGLLWLEWADWLGVGIGLLRNPDGEVSPSAFVDLINRCPEVSSTVHADDRDYAEWAFAIAIEHLEDHALVEDGALTDDGRATLHASLIDAWSRSGQ